MIFVSIRVEFLLITVQKSNINPHIQWNRIFKSNLNYCGQIYVTSNLLIAEVHWNVWQKICKQYLSNKKFVMDIKTVNLLQSRIASSKSKVLLVNRMAVVKVVLNNPDSENGWNRFLNESWLRAITVCKAVLIIHIKHFGIRVDRVRNKKCTY